MSATVEAHLFAAPSGGVPNNPALPLLVYRDVLGEDERSPAALRALAGERGWHGFWRGGVYPFHHYHSNGHEALGIYSGEVTVQFGGDAGVAITARPGDVIVLPAGTGHKKLHSRGALGVVGAYPGGSRPDTCTPPFARARTNALEIARVPLPACDPVHGPNGPLFEHWR